MGVVEVEVGDSPQSVAKAHAAVAAESMGPTNASAVPPLPPIASGPPDRIGGSAGPISGRLVLPVVLNEETMSGDERRIHPRVEFPVLVQFREQAAGTYESAYGADLSMTGLRVSAGTATPGALLDLQLIERNGHRPIEVLAEVIRADAEGFSVRFVELDDERRGWLASVIEGRRNQPDASVTEDLLVAGFDEL